MDTPIIHELVYLTKVINGKSITHYLFDKKFKIILPIKESECCNKKTDAIIIYKQIKNKYCCDLNLVQNSNIPIFVNKDILFTQGIPVSKELILNSLV